MWNIIKTRPVGVELLNAERQTDMTKVTVVFRNFEKELKNSAVGEGGS